MFEKISHNELISLTSVQEGPCVSIYIPTILPKKTLQLEYEALLRRASHLLLFDNRTSLREHLLDTLNRFTPSEYFSGKDKGLALFVNKHWNSYYTTGYELPSKTVVADSFHLKPLLNEIQGNHKYHILVISTEEAVLLQSESGKTTELHTFLLSQGKHSNSIHWKYQDQTETAQFPHLQAHTRGRGTQDNKFKKQSTKLFLKWIESKIHNEPNFESIPLFIFTSEPLFKAYNEHTRHPNPTYIKMEPTQGVPRIEALVHQANLQVQKQIARQKKITTQSISELNGKKMVIDDIFKISKAALGGRVKTLYLRDNIEIWGHLRRKSGEITLHERQLNSKDDDILDDIACEVIRHGGEVMVLSGKEMPTTSPAAAILTGL